MCYIKFGSYAIKGVRINRKEPQKLTALGRRPSWGGGVADPLSSLPTCVATSNLVVLHQRVCAYIEGISKIGERWGTAPLR